MGIMLGEGMFNYLVDDGGIISTCPYQLFEIVDNKLNPNWYFKSIPKNHEKYPYLEAVWGYYELCFEDSHYEKLIDMEAEAHRIYFRRKIEGENQFAV